MFHDSRIAIKVLTGFRLNTTKEKAKKLKNKDKNEMVSSFRNHSFYKRHFYRLLLATQRLKTAKALVAKISMRKLMSDTEAGFRNLYDYSRESQGQQMYHLTLVQKCFSAFRI